MKTGVKVISCFSMTRPVIQPLSSCYFCSFILNLPVDLLCARPALLAGFVDLAGCDTCAQGAYWMA